MRVTTPISESLLTVSAWVSFGTAVCGLIFMAAYALLARWWKSNEGKLLMAFAFVITFLTAYTWLVIKIIPDSTLARWVRVVGSGVVGLLFLAQTGLLIRMQTAKQKSDKERSQ